MSGGLATPAAAFGFSMEKILYIYIYIYLRVWRTKHLVLEI